MHDPWTDRLSEYLDRDLPAETAQQLEGHLAECDDCRTILAELRAVTAAAADLVDTPPQRDLWAGIAARIQAPATAPQALTSASHDDHGVVPLRASARVRRFSFSMPQLAAAAMLLMALSGTAAWYIARQADEPQLVTGAVVQTSGGAPANARTVATPLAAQPGYDADIAALERTLEQSRNQLDPATVEVVERSIESIDRAIADARAAIAADPGNPYLHRHLDNTMRKKIDILQHATGVQRGGS